MNMVSVAILAILVAGQDGRSPAASRADRPAPCAIAGPMRPAGVSATTTRARRPCHRPAGVPCSPPGIEDCDLEEGVDETWLIHLDAVRSEPDARPDWTRPRSTARPGPLAEVAPAAPAPFPLRC